MTILCSCHVKKLTIIMPRLHRLLHHYTIIALNVINFVFDASMLAETKYYLNVVLLTITDLQSHSYYYECLSNEYILILGR